MKEGCGGGGMYMYVHICVNMQENWGLCTRGFKTSWSTLQTSHPQNPDSTEIHLGICGDEPPTKVRKE